ncbi:putative replication-associated protein [Monocercomonoides exilis]|nr:putative replication-associated protein [Monocercomonoides exilis]KAH7814799.1 putative replication-associated protein [Monocercomonoides exilis]KAH7814801.1 putative replication-associated protein [Monocercomonoides exilis]KAH7814803.1 putative replication-associated protein [Monocercomonoides exilis]KAH7814805.1 putative replication-associated protein [Monocercomonoides exilis]
MISERCHLEAAKGSPDDNRKYCTKENKFFEKGELPQQGKRSDIDKAISMIQEGKSITEVAKEMPKQIVLHGKGLSHLANILHEEQQGDRTERRENYWLWGKTGSGKTTYVKNKAKELKESLGWRCYYWPVSPGFFTNYTNQEIAVFDDFDPHTMDFKMFLKITDPWCNPAINTKGDSGTFTSNLVFFTATEPAETILKGCVDTDDQMGQVSRRIKNIHVPNDLQEPNLDDETAPTQPDNEYDPFINQL